MFRLLEMVVRRVRLRVPYDGEVSKRGRFCRVENDFK